MDPGSPVSPAAAGFDRHGNPPSGEITSIGDGGGPREPGADREGDGKKLKGKASNSYPPIFRAKPGESYRDWRRSVDFWLGGEGHQIPPEYIGPRIMVQLRDRAAQLVKHLNNEDVNKVDGMAKIFQVLERSPLVRQLDKHRVDQHRKRLMALNRFPGESLESYITRGNIYRNQLLGLDSSLEMGERFYVGHLLDHAKLTRRDKALVRTRAGADTEEAVTNAMVELAAELEGEHGCPIGASEPNVAGANGEEWLVQRPGNGNYGMKKNFGKAALGAELVNDLTEEDVEHEAEDDGGDESLDGDLPPEVMEAEREAYAMHYKAKQRMAEVKKLRQFYKKGESNEERKKALAERIKSTACHNCGEIGHWSRECPKAAKLTYMATPPKTKKFKGKPSSSVVGTIDEETPMDKNHEWDLLVSLCSSNSDSKTDGVSARAYMAGPCSLGGMWEEGHEVLWCMQELKSAVILDLGCLKSVVGTRWMNQLLERWKADNRWFKVYPEKEVFRFGSGGTLTSRFAVNLLGSFCGKPVILCFSVVEGECPPLLSRPACTQLGAVFDCGSHTIASRKLGVKNFGLKQTDSGHYIMDIADFDNFSMAVHVPEDFRLAEGVDAVVWKQDDSDNAAGNFGSKLAEPSNEREAHVSLGEPSDEALQSMWRSRSPKSRLPLHRQRRGSAADAHQGGLGHGRHERDEPLSQGTPRPSRGRRLADEDGGDLCPRSTTASSSRGFMGGSGNPYVDAPSDPEGEGSVGANTALHPGRDGGDPAGESHREGDEDGVSQQGEERPIRSEEERNGGSDGSSGGISQPFKLLEWRGGDQHGGELSQSDDHLSV